MLHTIGIKEAEINKAVIELKNLKERLDEIALEQGKEEGDSGAACDAMENNKTEAEAVQESMKKLIDVTVVFLNGLKEAVKTTDKKVGRQMEQVM